MPDGEGRRNTFDGIETGVLNYSNVRVKLVVHKIGRLAGQRSSFKVDCWYAIHACLGPIGFGDLVCVFDRSEDVLIRPKRTLRKLSRFPGLVPHSQEVNGKLQHCTSARAGEGIRTLDVQLGKLAFYH